MSELEYSNSYVGLAVYQATGAYDKLCVVKAGYQVSRQAIATRLQEWTLSGAIEEEDRSLREEFTLIRGQTIVGVLMGMTN